MTLRRLLVRPVLMALIRPKVRGLENIPATGGVLLVSNHLSAADTVLLPVVCPRQIRFVAKKEYFRGPFGWFLRAIGTIPINRSGGRASMTALRAAAGALREGDVFGIYPEGTRSPDGRLYQGHTGVARLVQDTSCAVVPVAMIGTQELLPPYGKTPRLFVREPGMRFPRRVRIQVLIGEPLDFSRYSGMRDRLVLRSITDEIMYALMALSDQEYVDIYAKQARELLLAGQDPAMLVPPRRAAS